MRSVGAVISMFWIGFVLFGTWVEVTQGPTTNLNWLMRYVAVPREKVPNTVAPEGFGLYYHLVDPVPLFIVMLAPIILGWLLVSTWRRIRR